VTTILISAGDLSGERHAADFVRALSQRMPSARFVGMGGAAMAAAGVELHVDQRNLAVGGFLEILGSLGRLARAWRGMRRCLRETRPDLVVLVDSGGFNLPFARFVRRHSKAKILYYVAPQVWAWRPGRIRRLAADIDRIAVILPFEPAFYAKHGLSVDLVGHPAVDRFAKAGGLAGLSERHRDRLALGFPAEARLLGVFPGSRRNELAQHLVVQLEAFLRLRKEPGLGDLQALIGLASSIDPEHAKRIAAGPLAAAPGAIHFVAGDDGRLLDACDVALAKPGTVTVELMLRRRPMVVIGRAHPASVAIARRSLRVEWLAMPNLIAGREIVPELLQAEATPDRIAAALAPLFDGEPRARQIEALDQAARALGEPGAADRAAGIVEEMLGTLSA
jgi:lipid-A-disaccharide synthase